MQKHNLLLDSDNYTTMDGNPSMLLCVDPYEINPLVQMRNTSTIFPTAQTEYQAYQPPQSHWDMLNGVESTIGSKVKAHPKIKLEMEEFSDLSSFLPQMATKDMSNSADELNTPAFNKDAFDFAQYMPNKESCCKPHEFLKYENDSYDNISNINRHYSQNTGQNISFILPGNSVQNCTVDNTNACDKIPSEHSYLNNQNSPNFDQSSYAEENVSVNSIDNYDRYSCTDLSPQTRTCQYQGSSELGPDDCDSLASSTESDRKSQLRLKFNFDQANNNESVVSTPEVIEDVVNMENGGFNILDYMNEEGLVIDDPDLINSIQNTNTTESNAEPPPSTINHTDLCQNITSSTSKQRRPRKKRSASDDDEDYVPPFEKRMRTQRRKIDIDSEDSNNEMKSKIVKVEPKPRGRPPKRTESVSSDASKDSDISKYRELRDKNNEASRRSRMKRKMKELEFEKEAEELELRNVRLKTQVEELEKMVINFRTNLFKIITGK